MDQHFTKNKFLKGNEKFGRGTLTTYICRPHREVEQR